MVYTQILAIYYMQFVYCDNHYKKKRAVIVIDNIHNLPFRSTLHYTMGNHSKKINGD